MRIDQRLTKAADFAAVWRRGRRRSDALLVLIARRNGLSVARFGFSVGKRVGKAVVRNLVKRRIREAARAAPIRAGWDVVISARSGAAEADYHRLNRSLTTLMRRAGLLDDSAADRAPLPNGD